MTIPASPNGRPPAVPRSPNGRLDAEAKATGATRYRADIAEPGALEMVLVRCPLPHVGILGVATAQARDQPGVAAVLVAEDLPEGLAGRRVRDMPLLARGVARFAGEPVAVVVAESRVAAEAAARLVEVDYDERPAVLDPVAALLEGAPRVHAEPWAYPGAVVDAASGVNLQSVVTEGSAPAVADALAGATHVVRATYRTPAGFQGYLEPQAWVAAPAPGGVVRLCGTTKSPYRLREQVAATLELAPASIEIEPSPLGGDFGGKGGVVDAILCAAVARRLGRAVRLVLRSGEDITGTDARHPAVISVAIGCDRAGRLLGLDVDAVFAGGAYAAAKPIPSVNLHGVLECALGYRLPCYAVRSRVAYTTTLPKGHMRAPGAPQAVFAIESAVDELAAVAGIDPAELRRRNLLGDGDVDAYGHVWPEARGVATLDAALGAGGDDGCPAAPAGWSTGSGVAIYARPTAAPSPTSLGLVRLGDGRLEVSVPIPETGTGSHSVVRAQVAAALGIDAAQVTVRQAATSALGFDPGVGASRVTVGVCAAVPRLAEAWLAGGGEGPVSVEVPAGTDAPALSYCAQVARVALDPETGQVRVLELVSAVDVAAILSPRAHQLQIDGGAVMGYGFACLEDLLEEEGQVWASNLGEFKLPASADVPRLVTVLVEGGRGVGPAGVKAVGELANVPTAAAVANAVAAATGARVRHLPITAERVWWATQGAGAGEGPPCG